MIPLLSSLCYGTLEVCQLPRTWWKVLLRNAGILDVEYPDVSEGLDKSVLEVLNLDRETTLAYLRGDHARLSSVRSLGPRAKRRNAGPRGNRQLE